MSGAVVVMGLGRSGRAAAEVARDTGARVVGVDLRTGLPPIDGVELQLGPHDRATFVGAERIIVSPGIDPGQADLAAARAAGVPIIGELGYAASFLEDVPTIAITGTNGKSTVTWFTGQLLAAAGLRAFVGGNLGNPLCEAVLARGRGETLEALVVEVSSYQLENEGRFRPDVGVILNLTPDHLARHKTMDGYAAAKCRLFHHQGPADLAVLPVGDQRLVAHAGAFGTRAWLGALPGVRRDGARVTVAVPARTDRVAASATFDLSSFGVPGEHNRDNAATAALLALAIGAPPEAIASALPTLKPLEHRMEIVAEVGGVTWINDSKATNVDAARVGISGIDRPAVVLLGGQAKGDGFAALVPLLGRHRAVVCFGGSGPAIARELGAAGQAVVEVGSLADAVEVAAGLARPGDAVLLSPGCASFDAFQDFEHRGRVFRELVTRRSP